MSAPRQTKLARVDLVALERDYRNPAMPMIEITARHEISDASVRLLMGRLGVPLRPRGRPAGKSNPSRVSRLNVRLLLANGMTPREVAQRLRIDVSTVNRFRRDFKAGIEPRARGEQVNRKAPFRSAKCAVMRRCGDCLAIFSVTAVACPNGHAQPEVA